MLKPPRTLGISLAILVSVMLFTVIPLLQVAIVLIFEARTRSIDMAALTGDPDGVLPIATGTSIGGASSAFLIVQALLGVVFLVIAVFAWRGRPTSIRSVLLIAVVILTGFYVWDTFSALFIPATAATLDAGAGTARALQWLRLGANLLLPLYVLWYMNRAPARAFYRGSYDTE